MIKLKGSIHDYTKMSELNAIEENSQSVFINKGTGAGGANTNYYAKRFE